MILEGNQRGGAKDLAQHLLKDENDHVNVYELRGFVSNNLTSALNEAYAVSKGTRAKQFLYSLSLNPPKEEQVSTETFLEAIERAEQTLGLDNQPRAIVFHEKDGRRHCHAVWSRTDTQQMKAIPLPHTKRKLHTLSKDLYRENNWTMPRGFIDSKERDPRNFTHGQWQQAKRIGKDPRDIKTALQDSWAISDNQQSFKSALKEQGYTLARGDRCSFVAIDHRCEVYSLGKKWLGVSVKDIRTKITDEDNLPSVDEAKQQIAQEMQTTLSKLQEQKAQEAKIRLAENAAKRQQLIAQQTKERQIQKQRQDERQQRETTIRQQRFNTGLRGLLDRVSGRYKQLKAQNEQEAYRAAKRDQLERDTLIFEHLLQRRRLDVRQERIKTLNAGRQRRLTQDKQQYRDIRDNKREAADFGQKRQQTKSHQPQRLKESFTEKAAPQPQDNTRQSAVDQFKAQLQQRRERGPRRER